MNGSLTEDARDLEGVDSHIVAALETAGRELVASADLETSEEVDSFLRGRSSGRSPSARKVAVVSAAFGAKSLLGATAAAASVGLGIEVADIADVPVIHEIVEVIGIERSVTEEPPPVVTVPSTEDGADPVEDEPGPPGPSGSQGQGGENANENANGNAGGNGSAGEPGPPESPGSQGQGGENANENANGNAGGNGNAGEPGPPESPGSQGQGGENANENANGGGNENNGGGPPESPGNGNGNGNGKKP